VLKDDRAVAVEMLIEGDAVIRVVDEVGQRALTVLKPRPAEVLAVEFDQVEGAEHGGIVAKPIMFSRLAISVAPSPSALSFSTWA